MTWRPWVWAIGGGAVVGLAALGALEWQGLAAVKAPGQLETVVARGVRNWSIPAAERGRKNPLAGDAAALEQGRTLYFEHCSTCHGIGGQGATAVGDAVSPRVPDLRSAATQGLSDGELHYIIANGVRFTGMPALANVKALPANAGWELTLYVRSLGQRPGSPGGAAAAQAVPALLKTAHYVGSQACERCHEDIYQRWKKTPMANIVRDPATHPDAYAADPSTNTIAPFKPGQVALIYGSIWKQRYFTKVGNDYYPLPVQYDLGTHKWMPFHVPSTGADWWAHLYPASNMQRPTGPTCDGCHSVGYNIQTHQVAEWNVGCERCHGPGSEHVAHPTATNIINTANLGAAANTNSCVQCHSQGRPPTPIIGGKAYDWPVGYQVGLKLDDYWNLEKCTLGQTNFYYYPDCTAHKNRMQGNDFVQSVMYEHQISCTTCHDPHGSANPAELVAPVNKLCLNCHGPGSPNGPKQATIAEHTHHPANSPGSQCIACHMPQIEAEGVPGEGTNEMVHAHTFRVITPAMTAQYGIPNPCMSCHQDKTNAWATAALRSWPGSAKLEIP